MTELKASGIGLLISAILLLITVGFSFGVGFHIADQIIWRIADILKEMNGVPLG